MTKNIYSDEFIKKLMKGEITAVQTEIHYSDNIDINDFSYRYVLNQKIKDQLENYPNLKKYVEHYAKTNGKPEKEECISNLVYYFKLQCFNNDLDEEKTFNWNNETSEDFYSWGHNSRWAHTFDNYLRYNFQDAIEIGINLAKEYGDIDIDKE